MIFETDPARLPGERGAYLLRLRLDQAGVLRIADRDHAVPPGRYLYAGSARGPGGIRARAGRHLRGPRTCHWHIDRLTAVAKTRSALAWPGGDECALVAALLWISGIDMPVPGFGSSDCRRCPAHLLRLPDGTDDAPLRNVLTKIGLTGAAAPV